MFGLLMRFREKPIAVSGDIEGIFMQIGIKEDDQNVLRFFWPTNQRNKQYQYTRLVFGAECSPAIAIFTLHQTAVDFCNKDIHTQLTHNSFYMDDFGHSYDNLLEAKESTKALRMEIQKRWFNLTKFISNITEVFDFLNEPKSENKNPSHRVLGVKWDTVNDTLINQPVLKNNLTGKEMSLRKILSYCLL